MAIYVYVIGREQGPVKVGISANPQGRASGLQTGCPFPLSVLHTQTMRNRDHALWHEKNFRVVYADDHLIGEWFDLDADQAIDGIYTGLEREAARREAGQ